MSSCTENGLSDSLISLLPTAEDSIPDVILSFSRFAAGVAVEMTLAPVLGASALLACFPYSVGGLVSCLVSF